MNYMEINLNNELLNNVKVLADDYSKSITRDSADFYLLYYLNFAAHLCALYPVVVGLGVDNTSKVVEIGSGLGTRCMFLKGLFGCDVTGVEPHSETYMTLDNCISEMLNSNPHLKYNIVNSMGESTGLTSGYYDCILSFEVLEHVKIPKQVLAETYRLLKPGGKAFFSTCNYASFYEGHYRIYWNPFASVEDNKKRILRKGFSTKFLEELNYITKKQIVEYVEEIGFSKLAFEPPYSVRNIPDFNVNFPEKFKLPPPVIARPTYLQRFIQKPLIHKILRLIDREYKISFELVK